MTPAADGSAYDVAGDPAYELLGLLAAEFAEGGIASRVLPGDDAVPAQLMVPLDGEDGRSSTVHVCFVPGHEQPAVLQYLAVLDVELEPDAVPELVRFLHMVNSTLPLTGFELGESLSTVVFRTMQAVSVQPLDPGVVAWSLSMIHHAVTRFTPTIAAAAAGAPYAELVGEFGRIQAELFGS